MPLASGLYRIDHHTIQPPWTKEGQAKTGENVAS